MKNIFDIKKNLGEFYEHETKRNTLYKFFFLTLIVVAYFVFMSFKFGTADGFYVTVMTWSFFIFCTPIADAGFMLAFPVRLLLGVRMMYTQLFAFVIAFLLNAYAYFYSPLIYSKTTILNLFHHILSKPFPFWGIILLSIIGTLLSIYFGDELIDVSKHSQRKKYKKHASKFKFIIIVFLVAATIILYDFLLKKLGINISM